MQNFIKVSLFAAFFFISCSEKSYDISLLEQTRAEFEQNAYCLSLPQQISKDTKVGFEQFNIYPNWDKAIVSGSPASFVIEVPLSGGQRLAGVIFTGKDKAIEAKTSVTRSFLVIDGRETEHKYFVESFIEIGKRPKATLLNYKDKMNGFILFSELNGEISRQLAIIDGAEFEIKKGKNINSKHKTDDIFFGYRIAYETITKDNKGCPGDYLYVCVRCFSQFHAPMGSFDFTCPSCQKLLESDGDYFCPTCGRLYEFCSCQNPEGSCAPCGLNNHFCDEDCTYNSIYHTGTCNCGGMK